MARPANPDAHEALLEAARSEFARNGLERARVEDVARRAGVSKGAFYLHFRTKEDALQEILQRFMGALEEHARRRHEAEAAADAGARTGADGGARAVRRRLEVQFDTELLEIFWRNRLILAAVEGAGGPSYSRIVSDFRRRMRGLVSRRLHERQRSGVVHGEVDAEVLGAVIVGAYEGLGRRMIELREKPDLADWARSVLGILYDGILAPSPPTRRPRGARAV
jgi:AcrR family transcriptional regulator